MVVDGEPSEGGGLHEVEIAEVRGEKVIRIVITGGETFVPGARHSRSTRWRQIR